nr:MAG TPA: hypothetical protein [Caudoviricetes sp.]
MAMRHCRRAMAAWPLSLSISTHTGNLSLSHFDRSTPGRSFFFRRQRRRVSRG